MRPFIATHNPAPEEEKEKEYIPNKKSGDTYVLAQIHWGYKNGMAYELALVKPENIEKNPIQHNPNNAGTVVGGFGEIFSRFFNVEYEYNPQIQAGEVMGHIITELEEMTIEENDIAGEMNRRENEARMNDQRFEEVIGRMQRDEPQREGIDLNVQEVELEPYTGRIPFTVRSGMHRQRVDFRINTQPAIVEVKK